MNLRAGARLKSCLLAILLVFSAVAATITFAPPTSAITIGDGTGTNAEVTKHIETIICYYSGGLKGDVVMVPPTSASTGPLTATYNSADISEDWCVEKVRTIATNLEGAGLIASFNMSNLVRERKIGGDSVELSNLPPGSGATTTPTDDTNNNDDDDTTSGGTTDANCFSSAAALGWIMCPLINAFAYGASQFYTWAIEPFLSINTQLFAEGNTTYQAWSVFQTIANIAFIIVILVVIFSQITGLGIDNYGIKRLLPRLIISAILINLSYIICQLAVDISNILGYSLSETFKSIPVDQPEGRFISTASSIFSGLTVGLAVGGFAIASMGWAVVLSLLLALLSAVIAVFFMFVLLGVRQAGVVLLTVLAPLAIVCYMLPNTQSIFDRWKNMFIGLLLLFPICGLLIGAGDLASRILLGANQDSFLVGLIAMLINVVPFFLIPTLLRASFAAMGNIGAQISGLSNRATGIARPALERSRFGQFVKRDQAIREHERNVRNKQLTEAGIKASDQVRQGAYTGSNRFKRLKSKINERRASSTLPLWGTDMAALNREKRYRHMNANGQYDGSSASTDENMQMQGLLGGSVFQSDSSSRTEDVYEDRQVGTGIFDVATGKEIMRTERVKTGTRRVRENAVETRNTFEAHRGGMTSGAGQQTFNKWIADMKSHDISNAGSDFTDTSSFYARMAALGSGGESVQDQANTMFTDYMQRYEALGVDRDTAQREVAQQLGFNAMQDGEVYRVTDNVSDYSLHQLKDESRRRASEMNKRSSVAAQEAAVVALGQSGGDQGAAGGGSAGGGGPP